MKMPGCSALLKMAATMFKFWVSLEMNFIWKSCTLEAETLVSGRTFLLALTKNIQFLE